MSATLTVTIPSPSPAMATMDESDCSPLDRRGPPTKTKSAFMTVPRLICVNAVVCGLELCANAGFAYIPPILLKAGFSETTMSYIMGIGPVIALFSVPAIGAWSDRSRCPWGKRRPFILLLNLVMLCSLILVPLGHFHAAAQQQPLQAPGRGAHGNETSYKAIHHTSQYEPSTPLHWSQSYTFKTILLAIGVVLLDYASQACFNPCEALLTDVMKDDPNVERGFVIYSAMLSLGACLGTLTTAVDWTAFAQLLGVDVSTLIFGLLFVVSSACMVVTLAAAKETPRPASTALMSSYNNLLAEQHSQEIIYKNGPMNVHEKKYHLSNVHYQPSTNGLIQTSASGHTDRTRAVFVFACSMPRYAERIARKILRSTAAVGSLAVAGIFCSRHQQHQQRFLPCPRFNLGIFGLVWCLIVSLFRLLLEIFKWPLKFYCTYRDSPVALKRLFIADLASWTCLMGHGIFYTDFVAQSIYKGAPDADLGSEEAFGYDEGARMGSWGLCFFSIVGFGYSTFLQEWIVSKVGLRWNYMACLTALAVCMIGHTWFKSIYVLNALSALAGVGFAAVTSVPNTLITIYHSNLEVYDPKAIGRKSSVLEPVDTRNASGRRHGDVHVYESEQQDSLLMIQKMPSAGVSERSEDMMVAFSDDSSCSDSDDEHGRGVATDISLLDAAYFLSQILLSLTMGYLVDVTGSTTTYMAASAAAGILSIYLATKVPFTRGHLKALQSNGC